MSESRQTQKQCGPFVGSMLRRLGAVVTEKDLVWSARLTAAMAEALDVQPAFRFTGHAEAAGEEVELMTPEHPLVNALVDRTRQGGSYFHLMLAGVAVQARIRRALKADAWVHEENGYWWAPLNFKNIRVRPLEKRLLYQRVYWFRFAVAYVADVQEEKFIDVWLDAQTESPTRPRVWQEAVGMALPRHGGPSAYVYERLYTQACRQLQATVQQQLTTWQQGGDKRLAAEISRIEAYYRDVATEAALPLQELVRMGPSLSVAVPGKENHWDEFVAAERAIRQELDVLERQRQRHLQEARRRHQGRAEARLISVVCMHVPRVEWTLRLACTARPTITVCYDVADDVVMEPRCEHCESTLHHIFVHHDGTVYCPQCAKSQQLTR